MIDYATYAKLRGKLVNSSVNADMRLTEVWSISAGHSAVRAPTVLSPPSNAWTGIALYWGCGLALALLPWLSRRFASLEPSALRTRPCTARCAS